MNFYLLLAIYIVGAIALVIAVWKTFTFIEWLNFSFERRMQRKQREFERSLNPTLFNYKL